MQKLSDQITVRLPPDLRAAIQEIELRHRIGAAEFIRGMVEAGVTMYQQRGFFGFPVEVIPDRKFVAAVTSARAAADDPAGQQVG